MWELYPRVRRWPTPAFLLVLATAAAPAALPATARAVVPRGAPAAAGVPGNARGQGPAITPDGRYLAFTSTAATLVPGDSNRAMDVFVRDRAAGTTERVSVPTGGGQGDAMSFRASISADGRYVTFASAAANLVPGDTNGAWDVFVRDRVAGTTERVSVAGDGTQGDRPSRGSALSADGRYVAFSSSATNLVPGDTNGTDDVFVRDRIAGTTERVSVPVGGGQAAGPSTGWAISADGRSVAFGSAAANLVPGDTNGAPDIFVRDRAAGTTSRASVAGDGTQADAASQLTPLLSPDGRHVAFASQADNLVPGDTNGRWDMFVRDLDSGRTELVSAGGDGESATDSVGVGISADGRYVTFTSAATTLVPGDTNLSADAFVRDRAAGVTELVDTGGGYPAVPPPPPLHPGPTLDNNQWLVATGVEGTAVAAGAAYLEVPFFSRSTAGFEASTAVVAWGGAGIPDRVTLTERWSVSAFPGVTASRLPPGAVDDGNGTVTWQGSATGVRSLAHAADGPVFSTPGVVFQSTHTVTGTFRSGTTVVVVSAADSGAT
ncbi:MAG: TolB family protein [Mycobacteriales bacterium]